MATPRVPLLDRAKLQSSLKELAASADTLNSLSDQLNAQVAEVESAVNKTAIGLTASVNTEDWADERGDRYDIWRICYAKHQNKWGFTIEHHWGLEGFEESNQSETWAFKEAPREHRLKAVAKIPDLIDALVKKAKEFASNVSATMIYTQGLVAEFSTSDAGKK